MKKPAAKAPLPRNATAKAARPAAVAKAPTKTVPAKRAAAKTTAMPAAKRPDGGGAKAADEKADKPRKSKLVRDSFTIPKVEYTVLEDLKQRAARLGRPTKKSEVLRAGVKALAAMGDEAFLASVAAVPAVKTGRPAKD